MDWTLILTPAASIGTFLFGQSLGRKKTVAEVKSIQAATDKTEAEEEQIRLNNLTTTISIYERVHNELSKQLTELSAKCTQLSEEIAALREENKKLTEKITAASQENQSLKQELHSFKEKFPN